MSAPQKLTRQEIMTQLFDGLMERIEPALMTVRLQETAKKLAAMSPEERKARMEQFQKAYEAFLDQWPAYVQKATETVESMANTLQKQIIQRDAQAMEDLERTLRSEDA